MPEGASESEAAHLRIVSLEETRSQHQANTLTMLRLSPGPSTGHHAGVRRRQKPQAQVRCVPIRKFICISIRRTSQPWKSRALVMCSPSLTFAATIPVRQLQLLVIIVPHSARHALLQSHHIETLRALAPSLRTHDVHVTICCTHRPRSHRFSTPLLTLWLQVLRHGFQQASLLCC